MPQIGHMEVFDDSSCDWATYVERLRTYLQVNDIPEAKRVPALLSLIGGKTYTLLRSLLAPETPASHSFNELVDALQQHFTPTPLVIAERFRFHKRNQDDQESAQQYVAALKKLSEHCDFGTTLNDALRDRFVCGIRNDTIQRRLLTEPDLTFQRAVEIAVGMETAARDACELSADVTRQNSSASVHVLHQKQSYNFKRQDNNKTKKDNNAPCWRCGNSDHKQHTCRFKNETCRYCGKTGHIVRVCKTRQRKQQTALSNVSTKQSIGQIEESDDGSYLSHKDNLDELSIHTVDNNVSSPLMIEVMVENKKLSMELDTGAAVSVISSKDYEKSFSCLPLIKADSTLKTYTGERIIPLGILNVQVTYNQQNAILQLYVIEGNRPPLFGRSWLHKFKLDWKGIKTNQPVRSNSAIYCLSTVMEKHSELFKEELGTMKNAEIKLYLKPNTKPRFFKTRPVPFAIKPKVEAELKRLEDQGIISPIESNDWATPIVPVMKPDGNVRLCGDYKITVNPYIEVEKYPLPRIEDMFANLSGGKKFTKLDLYQAYQQMKVDDDTSRLLCINTHKGLYKVNRLAFGITSAAAIFQRSIEQVLQGIEGVIVYQDDILISGSNDETHFQTLDLVLTRLKQHGLRLKKKKCVFFAESLEYLGHVIDAHGLHPSPKKTEAIINAPTPKDVTQLRSFLGLVNYYGKFIPNLSSRLKPLHKLLERDEPWSWTDDQGKAFEDVKQALISSTVLVHFDSKMPITLACDASSYGIGAVIAHIMPSGEERPIAFTSRTLSKSEIGYSQLEKEALSIINGVRKFHQYLFGKHFTLLTDHQPLVKIFGPTTGIPTLAAARLQRWALILTAHSYDIKYRSTSKHFNADGLSRLPLTTDTPDMDDVADIYNMSQIECLPVKHDMIGKETQKDPILSKVHTFTLHGWPDNIPDELRPYFARRDELTVQQKCLLWGVRVVIPSVFRDRILEEIHQGHFGIVRMKSIARSFVWWPNIDFDIESIVKTCKECQLTRNQPCKAPLHPWMYPLNPWERIHLDFAGPLDSHMFLVCVDGYSKWPEVLIMPNITSKQTVDALRNMFARFGLPQQVVTDNGPQFTSEEFRNFMLSNGIQHICSAPYHPSTNGQAERFVQTLKNALKRNSKKLSLQHALADFLLKYRATPHATTGDSPANLMFRRNIRTRLDLVRPDLQKHVRQRQEQQVIHREQSSKDRSITVGDQVLVRDYRPNKTWTPGTIAERTGPVSFRVDTGSTTPWRRHQDQILSSSKERPSPPQVQPQTLSDQSTTLEHNTDSALTATTTLMNPRRNPPRACRQPRRLDL